MTDRHTYAAPRQTEMTGAEREALAFLMPLSADYPGIAEWFAGRVVPGLRNGTRVLVATERHGKLVAVGIAKHDAGERKLCTVRVAPEAVGRGHGMRTIDALLDWLKDDRPHLTVAERNLETFARILDRYGFRRTSASSGLYVPERTELLYNETRIAT